MLKPGETKGGKPGERDAVHVAIITASYNHKLEPGQQITVNGSGNVNLSTAPNAIVDPFLDSPVEAYDNFLAFMMPGSTEQLGHVFKIKGYEFPDEEDYDECSTMGENGGPCN